MLWFNGVFIHLLMLMTYTGMASFVDPTDLFNYDQMQKELFKKNVKDKEESDSNVPSDSVTESTVKSSPHDQGHKNEEEEVGLSVYVSEEFNEEKAEKSQMQTCSDDKIKNAALTLFQQFVMTLVHHSQTMTGSSDLPTDFCLRARATQHDLLILKKFGNGDTSSLYDTHEKLSSLIVSACELPQQTRNPILWLEISLGLSFPLLLQMNIGLLLIFLSLKIVWKNRLSIFKVKMGILLVFAISVAFTWYEMYQKKVSAKEKILMEKMSTRCPQLKNLSIWERVTSFIGSTVTFQDENCREYFDAMFINPAIQVSPLEAMAIAVIKTLVSPMKIIGQGLKDLITGLFKDLPFQFALFLMPLVYITTIMTPLMLFGYRIRIPFLLAIEPTAAPQDLPDREIVSKRAIRAEQGQGDAGSIVKKVTGSLKNQQICQCISSIESHNHAGSHDTFEQSAPSKTYVDESLTYPKVDLQENISSNRVEAYKKKSFEKEKKSSESRSNFDSDSKRQLSCEDQTCTEGKSGQEDFSKELTKLHEGTWQTDENFEFVQPRDLLECCTEVEKDFFNKSEEMNQIDSTESEKSGEKFLARDLRETDDRNN